MQRKIFLLILSVACICINGIAQFNSVYDQLVSVNPEWRFQADAGPQLKSTAVKLLDEQQLIQLHLSETEKLLRHRDVSGLPLQLQQNRKKNLDVLHGYLLAGVFPINTGHVNRQPYFIDQYNTYCAVGYLMKESGADDVARDIKRTQNYSYLKDIQHPKLTSWVQQSGLTLDELALIQPAYAGEWPCSIIEFHYNNTGADVNEYIEVHQSSITMAGMSRFTTVLFYDQAGTLYKSLPIAQMQTYGNVFGPVYYYMFPSNENFADIGRVELRGDVPAPNTLISSTSYTGSSVQVTTYYPNPASPTVRNFPVGENETTPANFSLSYCGFYYDASWNLQRLLATNGGQNPCIIMPIALRSFSGSVNGKVVNLLWETSTEVNSKTFIVERSTDGINFETIGSVQAAGNSNAVKQYTLIDRNPGYINHYRLRLLDIDGKAAYSKIVYAKVEKASPLHITQNLVSTELRYQVDPVVQKGAKIILYDLTGRTMYTTDVKTGAGNISVSGWNPGKYIIRLVTAGGMAYTEQFMKQ